MAKAVGVFVFCFKTGERVAVVFSHPCTGLLDTPQGRRVLVGATISGLVWQPAPWQVTDGLGQGM